MTGQAMKGQAVTAHTKLKPSAGQVTLVGAGPGAADLLTLRAVKAIQSASLLLVDDLVGDEVVALAAPTARVVHVGKRGGCQSTPQAWIEAQMVSAALQGEQVVRLKGGDPLIFGRGGEEIESLRAAGVAVSVVNGITAGLAAVAALELALTHRTHAQGVVFVTGHAQAAGAGVDWPTLAHAAQQAKLTLVIYMGVRNVGHIQAELLQGLPASTPVAVVHNATLASQRHCVCTLGNLDTAMQAHAMRSPSVMVVGQVAQGLLALQDASLHSLGA